MQFNFNDSLQTQLNHQDQTYVRLVSDESRRKKRIARLSQSRVGWHWLRNSGSFAIFLLCMFSILMEAPDEFGSAIFLLPVLNWILAGIEYKRVEAEIRTLKMFGAMQDAQQAKDDATNS